MSTIASSPPQLDRLRESADGYAVRSLIGPETVARLLDIYHRLAVDPEQPFLASNRDLDREGARAVDQQLKAELAEPLAAALPGFEPFIAAFIVKGGTLGDRVEFHQDWTYTEEPDTPAVLVWIPLVDVSQSNGALAMVRGSHRWSHGIRPSGAENPAAELQADLAAQAVLVPLRAGEAVFYDPAILHGSPPNVTASPRPAVAVGLRPAGGSLVHFCATGGEATSGHQVDESWFTLEPFAEVPADAPTVEAWAPRVDVADLRAGLGVHPAESDAAVHSSHRSGPDLERVTTTPILRDPDHDEALRRDGYASFPLLDADAVARLREDFGRLHGWHGAGFHADLAVDAAPYRRAVKDLLQAELGAIVTDLFVDHVPFLRNFLCKWPGEGSSLYLHQDWMYVDERIHEPTYVVWIPLQDIGLDNGPLEVLPGSHRLDRSLRGVELTGPWMVEEDEIRPRLVSLPVPAGTCVIMDNGLVHCSPDNLTDEPRVIAAMGMRPRTAPLVLFRRVDDRTAARYHADEEYFVSLTPGALHQAPPNRPLLELIDLQGEDLSRDDLARRMDQVDPRGPFTSAEPTSAPTEGETAGPSLAAERTAPVPEPAPQTLPAKARRAFGRAVHTLRAKRAR